MIFFGGGRGNGGRCRRHAPTEAKKTADAEAPARHGRLGMSVFADGQKTDRKDEVDAKRELSVNEGRSGEGKRDVSSYIIFFGLNQK